MQLIEIARTWDLRAVKSILAHPSVWPFIGDDSWGDPAKFTLNADSRIWYLLAKESGRTVGVLTFGPRNQILYESHVALLPRRNARGRDLFAKAIEFMFENSPALHIIGEAPAHNGRAVAMCRHVMKEIGRIPRGTRKHGEIHDLIIFGIERSSEAGVCPA